MKNILIIISLLLTTSLLATTSQDKTSQNLDSITTVKKHQNLRELDPLSEEERERAQELAEEARRKVHESRIERGAKESVFGTYSGSYPGTTIDNQNSSQEKHKSDNNTLIIIIGVSVIVILLIIGFFMFSKKKPEETDLNTRNVSPEDLEPLKEKIDEVHHSLFHTKKGLEALTEMANKGDSEAQYNLGTRYFKEQDYDKAKFWFEQSGLNGDKDSQYQMGNLFLQGLGVEKDLKKAFTWYEKAALQEHPQSQHNLGLFYLQGEIIEKNNDKAIFWFRRAAENGYESSKQILENLGAS